MTVPPLLIYIAAFLGFARGIYWLFEKAEDLLNKEAVHAISQRLQGLDPGEQVKNWPDAFAKAFDVVFGDRTLSWKRVWRSSLASLAAITIMFAIAWSVMADAFRVEFADALGRGGGALEPALFVLFVGGMINVAPDYLSLAESRWVIQRIQRTDKSLAVAYLLVLDFIITFLIFALGLAVLATVASPFLRSSWPGLEGYSHLFTDLIDAATFSSPDGPMISVFLYSTFFTSIWVWLFALSTFIVRGANLLDRNLGRFNRWFDAEKPLRALGFVSCLLVTLAFLVGGVFFAV